MDSVLKQFREFDANGDGIITKAELRRVLRGMDSRKWTEKRINQLVRCVDRNGDGQIQFEEFVAWLYGGEQDVSSVFSETALKGVKEVLRSKARSANAAAKAGDFTNALRLAREQPEVVNMALMPTGDTLLHQAASQGNAAALAQLLALGGDPLLANTAGETAVQVAQRFEDKDVLVVLRTQGFIADSSSSQSMANRQLRRSRTDARVSVVPTRGSARSETLPGSLAALPQESSGIAGGGAGAASPRRPISALAHRHGH